MKKVIAVLMIAASTMFSVVANAADDGVYLGINFAKVDYKEDGFETVSPTALSFKLGKNINQNFAAEVRFGTGIADDEIDLSGVTVSVDLDSYFGLYLKGIAPLSQHASIYGLAGYSHGKLTFSSNGFSDELSENDISFGIGADFDIRDILTVNVEWARLLKGDDYKVEGLSVGVSKKF